MLLSMDRLVGAAEIGLMLGGLSRQRITQLANQPDFPEPVARLRMGAIWRAADVQRWAIQHGRQIDEGWASDEQ